MGKEDNSTFIPGQEVIAGFFSRTVFTGGYRQTEGGTRPPLFFYYKEKLPNLFLFISFMQPKTCLSMRANVHTTIKSLLNEKLTQLEANLDSDIFCYYGAIMDGLENDILAIIEELSNDAAKRDRLTIILTTPGGSAFAVERYVNIVRHHYTTVDFIIPDSAYSAGTIFCMSGDNIYMDYSSVLGPIDPQVQNKEGKWVAALGYLDKVNDAIAKSVAGTLSEAEFLMVKDLDLSELRSYEQAKELTNDLLKKWLVQYKFKNWTTHQTTPALIGQSVTAQEKVAKAEEIANSLNDSGKWKSHGRPIHIDDLVKIGLKIEDYSKNNTLRNLIREYYQLLNDFINQNKLPIFVHTRKFI
ncbi:MAG: serine dehydrogenasease [Sediminibacterium sp.]